MLYTKQYDIYEVDLSDLGFGILPCVIIQNNIGNKFSPTTIVAPLLREKGWKGYLYCDINSKKLGKLYVYVSFVKTIDKSRIIEKNPIGTIEDIKQKKKLSRFMLANMGIKTKIVNGEKQVIELSNEELDLFYKESSEC